MIAQLRLLHRASLLSAMLFFGLFVPISFLNAQVVSTFAGNGTTGNANGTGTAARFDGPIDIAADGAGNFYVADRGNHLIRKITSAAAVTTFAGSTNGWLDATGTGARFSSPSGVAVDASGNVYVADFGNNRIRKITPGGVVTTFAGSGTAGNADGNGTAAQFRNPYGVAVDASGNVYVADYQNHAIRVITPSGDVTTLAGSTQGFADGTGTAARFSNPSSVAIAPSGNIIVVDQGNSTIREVTPAGVVTALAGGNGLNGFANGTGTVARFNNPIGLAIDGAGNITLGDQSNNRIRVITPSGAATTIAGAAASGFTKYLLKRNSVF